MATHLWANFVTSLETRGVLFQQVQHASDRHAVIVEAGFTDPISIAILETEWIRRTVNSDSAPPTAKKETAGGPAATSAVASTVATVADYTKLEEVPEEIQDRVVTMEVLAAAAGQGGALLQASRDGFTVSRHVPVSMRSLCKTIVPVADSFVALRNVERAEHMGKSLVAMALGEVVSEICTSYVHEIAVLERWAQSKTMPLMAVVSEILRAGHHIVRMRQLLPTDVVSLNDDCGTLSMMGWRLLNHIHDQVEKHSGSKEDEELLLLLLRRATVPYLRLLHRWMHEGVLEDPYKEFFIIESEEPAGATPSVQNGLKSVIGQIFHNSGNTDDYGEAKTEEAIAFERRFSMNKNMIPNFLVKNPKTAKMIFYAGKYCCLLREYNSILPEFGDVIEDMLFWTDADKLQRKIEKSYEIASGAVLRLFLGSQVDLLGHLSSLKNYFLHERGDWLVDFLDSAEKLLVKSPVQVKMHSVRVLLQAAIARCCGRDHYHTIIGCSFTDSTIEQHVNGTFDQQSEGATSPGFCGRKTAMRVETRRCIELLQLEADLRWPLTMILDTPVIRRLNVVFRLFTWLKVCERNLSTAWTDADIPRHYPKAYSIKHQLIQFIRQFQFYAAHFVVEPLWSRMMVRIGQADSVFAVSNALQDFFDGVELGLLLASANRFQSLSRILGIATSFSEIGQQCVLFHMGSEQLQETLQSVEERFLKALSELASPVGADYPRLIPLLTWIDFSGYYDRNGVYRVLYTAGVSTELMSSAV